jgi:hypothetical protein
MTYFSETVKYENKSLTQVRVVYQILCQIECQAQENSLNRRSSCVVWDNVATQLQQIVGKYPLISASNS